MTTTTIIAYTTWGAVRGRGPVRTTRAAARADLAADHDECAEYGGYSDRSEYGVDATGLLHRLDDVRYYHATPPAGAWRLVDPSELDAS